MTASRQKRGKECSQTKRLCAAGIIVSTIIVAMVLSASLPSMGADTVYRNFTSSMVDVPSGNASDSASEDGRILPLPDWLERFDSNSNGAQRRVPDGFQEELFDVAGFDDVRTSENGTVVGLLCSGSAMPQIQQLKTKMTAHGWAVASDNSTAANGDGVCTRCDVTFVKDAGRYRWAFITGMDISGSASLVVSLA